MADKSGTIDYDALGNASRLLMECDLEPLQGHRFQPTGFADLGPARYALPDGTEMLLVESAQSVANRLELACWDATAQDLIEPLRGLPYVRVKYEDNEHATNSLLEAHRINSEYIVGKRSDGTFKDVFKQEIAYQRDDRVAWTKFHRALFKYDTNSLLHGCFLEEIDGRLRITRAVSGFIEASGVRVAESGGVKNNIVQPELRGGEGNVPFSRTEFVAQRIAAYFNLDLALLRGYGLPDPARHLLVALALLKIRRFLCTGLRLRTACDLQPVNGGLKVARPDGFSVPEEQRLLEGCRTLIGECTHTGLFAKPSVTDVRSRLGRPTPSQEAAKEGGEGEELGEEDAE
jgi:CRISPR-associated protein Csb1